jgi:hypothetical protein
MRQRKIKWDNIALIIEKITKRFIISVIAIIVS